MKLLFVHDFPVEHEVNTTNYYSTGFLIHFGSDI